MSIPKDYASATESATYMKYEMNGKILFRNVTYLSSIDVRHALAC